MVVGDHFLQMVQIVVSDIFLLQIVNNYMDRVIQLVRVAQSRLSRGGRYYRIKLSIADISAFLQLIGKLSLSKKIDLGIIEKLSLSKRCI